MAPVPRPTPVALAALTLAALASAACGTMRDGALPGATDGRASGAIAGGFAPLARAEPPPVTSHCSPAPQLHATALCVCKDLVVSGELLTRASGGRAADVGVEGSVSLSSGSVIQGSLRATGDITTSGELSVHQHLWSKGGISFSGSLRVDGELASGGDLIGSGELAVGGSTHVSGSEAFSGDVTRGGQAPYAAPQGSPCGCSDKEIYDVAAAVRAAMTANDNRTAGVAEGALTGAGDRRLDLPTGRYYLSSGATSGSFELRARGAVQLYVDGDLSLSGEGRVVLEPGASLDLFVAGALTVSGELTSGNATAPDALRLYVGGKDARVSLAGAATFRGLVYAPTAEVAISGEANVEGALFAGSLSHSGSLSVGYAPVTKQGERCEHPEATPRAPATPAVVR